MSLNERQYERIARRLDGEQVELSAEEQAVAEEIRSGEGVVGQVMEVSVSPRALEQARRRMAARPVRLRRRILRFSYLSAAAVAAILVLAVTLFWQTPTKGPSEGNGFAAAQYVVPELTAQDVEIELLASEIDELAAELTLSDSFSGLDGSLDVIEEDIERFWLDESLPTEKTEEEVL